MTARAEFIAFVFALAVVLALAVAVLVYAAIVAWHAVAWVVGAVRRATARWRAAADDTPADTPADGAGSAAHICHEHCPCWWVNLLDEDQAATEAEAAWNCRTKRGAR